jgi:hypothetical protein
MTAADDGTVDGGVKTEADTWVTRAKKAPDRASK